MNVGGVYLWFIDWTERMFFSLLHCFIPSYTYSFSFAAPAQCPPFFTCFFTLVIYYYYWQFKIFSWTKIHNLQAMHIWILAKTVRFFFFPYVCLMNAIFGFSSPSLCIIPFSLYPTFFLHLQHCLAVLSLSLSLMVVLSSLSRLSL